MFHFKTPITTMPLSGTDAEAWRSFFAQAALEGVTPKHPINPSSPVYKIDMTKDQERLIPACINDGTDYKKRP